MLYLSNLEKNLSNRRGIKVAFVRVQRPDYKSGGIIRISFDFLHHEWGGRVVRWCWVNFQYWGVLLIWTIVGQGPIALAVGAGWGLFGHFFSPLSFLSYFSFSL